MSKLVSAAQMHACRVYWGHCGCSLYRGHELPHIGLHVKTDSQANTVTVEAHVMGPGVVGYEYIFGEDATC